MLLFCSYSTTASDGSLESTAGRVASPCSVMMHHGLRSKEARRARKQKYRLHQTSHSSMLVARQGDVTGKLNQAFLLVDSFSFNFVDEECSDINQLFSRQTQIYHRYYSCVSPQNMNRDNSMGFRNNAS